jgi:hypothetical protein
MQVEEVAGERSAKPSQARDSGAVQAVPAGDAVQQTPSLL